MTRHVATQLGRLLTVNELAAFLGVSRNTVYDLVRRGELTPVRVSERFRFAAEDVRVYLERSREERSL